jgi:putative phosphoribosyl transferase
MKTAFVPNWKIADRPLDASEAMATSPGRVIELPALHNRLGVFRDRRHAGEVLADMLSAYRGSNALVLGIPAGGAPVAAAIARALALPLDMAVVSKLTLPWNTEAGYGALAFDGTLRLNNELVARAGLSEADVETGKVCAQGKVTRRIKLLRGDRSFPELSECSAILVDDGLASGFTLLVAIEALRHQKAKEIVVAVPTAHAESAARIAPLVEALYCPNLRDGPSFAVADAYQEWSDVAEETVVALLRDIAQH